MAKVLDSLNSIADPNTNYFLSGRKAAQMLQESHNYTNPIDIINWETKYCFELLNSGNTDQSIKTLTAMINKYPGGGEKALADPNFKKVFERGVMRAIRLCNGRDCVWAKSFLEIIVFKMQARLFCFFFVAMTKRKKKIQRNIFRKF